MALADGLSADSRVAVSRAHDPRPFTPRRSLVVAQPPARFRRASAINSLSAAATTSASTCRAASRSVSSLVPSFHIYGDEYPDDVVHLGFQCHRRGLFPLRVVDVLQGGRYLAQDSVGFSWDHGGFRAK